MRKNPSQKWPDGGNRKTGLGQMLTVARDSWLLYKYMYSTVPYGSHITTYDLLQSCGGKNGKKEKKEYRRIPITFL